MTLTKGTAYVIQAEYLPQSKGDPPYAVMRVRSGDDCEGNVTKTWKTELTGSNKYHTSSQSFEWTPTTVGTFTVYCGLSATGYSTCYGACGDNTDPNNLVCIGPQKRIVVKVVAACTATAPTLVSSTRVSSTKATFTWTKGSGGTKQYLYVGTKSQVANNCASGCAVKETNLGAGIQSYTTGNVLTPGTVYYWKVGTYESATCDVKYSATKIHLSSCLLSPSTMTLRIGGTGTLTSVVSSSSEITRVNFSSSTSRTSVSPTSDSSYVYSTTVTGSSAGSSTLTGTVVLSDSSTCSGTATASVSTADAWWQVKDSDVLSKGVLKSTIPLLAYFNLKGSGGYPGVTVYSDTTNLTSSNVSEKGWLAHSSFQTAKVYNSDYFINTISSVCLA